ncbi:hypothetical protein C0J52_22376 [Blattella germanica]|nr:hypothetical protein C0J52_22376 [Blattella germanica]
MFFRNLVAGFVLTKSAPSYVLIFVIDSHATKPVTNFLPVFILALVSVVNHVLHSAQFAMKVILQKYWE